MKEFFKRIFGDTNGTSGQKAADRLKIVLMHDRTDISPQLLESLRLEIVQVLLKYMDIDRENIEIELDKDGKALLANIPVRSIKRASIKINA